MKHPPIRLAYEARVGGPTIHSDIDVSISKVY